MIIKYRKKLRTATVFLVALIAVAMVASCQPAAKPPMESDNKTEAPQKQEPAKAEFTNPELTVNTDWLADHLQDNNLKIIDVRKVEDYSKSHIPGALNLPIDSTVDATSSIPGIVAPPDKIEQLLGGLGISNDSKIIVYDEGSFFSDRVAWVLQYNGAKEVIVLDGGFKKWQTESKDMNGEMPQITPATFSAEVDQDIIATTAQVKDWIAKKNKDIVFVDTRPANEWILGHLPDAIRLDWVELMTKGDAPVLKDAEALEKVFKQAGITKDQDLVLY